MPPFTLPNSAADLHAALPSREQALARLVGHTGTRHHDKPHGAIHARSCTNCMVPRAIELCIADRYRPQISPGVIIWLVGSLPHGGRPHAKRCGPR